METVDVAGLTIAFERRGDGPGLMLLHGGLSDHREWRRQLDGLSDAFTVVAWDAPGCGGSSDPPDDFGFADYADVLAGLIEAIGLDQPHVCGLSWGSTLALKLYQRAPDRVRTLILTAAYAGWAGSLPPKEIEERLQGASEQFKRPPREWVHEWIPTLFTEHVPQSIVDEMISIMADTRPVSLQGLFAMAEEDLRDVLPTIDVPTLLLYGAEDVRSPRSVAEDLHRGIAGSELVFIAEVGHQANVEAADRFNNEIRAFLAGR